MQIKLYFYFLFFYQDSNSINNFMSDLYRNSPKSGASSTVGDNSRPTSPVSREKVEQKPSQSMDMVESATTPQVEKIISDSRKSLKTKKVHILNALV